MLLREEGGRRVYGDPTRVVTTDLVPTLERVRDVGAEAVAELLPELETDIRAYRVASPEPLETKVRGFRILSTPRPSLGGAVVECVLERLSVLDRPSLVDEVRAVAEAYGPSGSGPLTGTTHISVIGSFNGDKS